MRLTEFLLLPLCALNIILVYITRYAETIKATNSEKILDMKFRDSLYKNPDFLSSRL
jgi:hypothetical protein